MAHYINPGGNLNLTPAPTKQAAAGNYLDFTADGNGWAQQYVPDLMEKEAEVFGNRTVSGFLAQVGAEEAMASDQVVWSEQGRLHLSHAAKVKTGADGLINMLVTDHGIRKGDTVVVSTTGLTLKGYVSAVGINAVAGSGNDKLGITVLPYTAANLAAIFTNNDDVNVFVYGSEYQKGTEGRGDVIAPKFKSYTNKPIILKDKYEISGSDASAIGWVEVSGEEGQNGYLWYLKASGDTKARFADYCEMSLLEAEKYDGGTALNAHNADITGTEGLFAAITDRGNITTQVSAMDDFDTILKEFDKQGAIEENMMFVNRTQALNIDDMLSDQSGSGAAYGVFNNDVDMALNLGFSGFRRGSYDFYKTDWKYLNDVATRGGVLDSAAGSASDEAGGILGVIVPAGVSSVYDQGLGRNLKRPFLHVRYRASGLESRKMKTWTTGSVGAVTSDIDAMEMHFLSERCLVVQGANNFMLIKGDSGIA
jgi:hypothetical protein